jgi:hypothetical protein
MINARAIFVLVIWSFVSSACAVTPNGPVETWTVMDRNTKKPIPSAWVTIQFQRDVGGPPHGSSVCARSKSLIADEKGQFTFERSSLRDDLTVYAYKSGFVRPFGKSGDYQLRETYLVPFEGDREDAFQKAILSARSSGCHGSDSDVQELARRKHFLEDARRLADPNNADHTGTILFFEKRIEDDERHGMGAK